MRPRKRFSIINCRKGLAVKIHKGALLLATGIAIGALTSGVLRAQNPPPAFTIAEIQVNDPEAFKDYASATGAGIPAAGGRFIVRSGKSFVINGEPPKSIAVIQWDTLYQARTYFESPDYKKLTPVRDKASKFRAFSIEGAAR
jgi:uncharacterized protein (DUF1330 family)